MTDDKIALRELLEKGSDAIFLCEMIGVAYSLYGRGKVVLTPLPSFGDGCAPRSLVSLASSIKSTTRRAERPLPITTLGSGATRSVHCAGTGQMTPSSKRKSSRFPKRL